MRIFSTSLTTLIATSSQVSFSNSCNHAVDCMTVYSTSLTFSGTHWGLSIGHHCRLSINQEDDILSEGLVALHGDY